MTEEIIKREPLSPQQYVAARMLARGLPRKDVADLVGVHEKTVQIWRNRTPEFMDLLERETMAYVEAQEPIIARYRSEILHGMSVGVAKLIQLTEAEYEGLPLADVQQKAAEKLAAGGVAMLRALGEKQAEVQTPAGQTVVIELRVADDAIDAEFEEVSEDGEGQGTGADDDHADATGGVDGDGPGSPDDD